VVTLTAPAPVTLSVDQNPFNFNCGIGASGQCTQKLLVTSNGSVPFNISAGAKSTGFPSLPLSFGVNPSSGTADATGATVTITGKYSGLAPGTYAGTITITSSGAANSPLVVPVSFILQGTDTLLVTSNPVSLSAAAGATSVVTQNVAVQTQGLHSFSPLSFTASASSSGGWLSVSSLNPSATAAGVNITVGANPAGLSANASPYNGTVTLTDTAGNPTIVKVTLTITAAQITVSTNPSPLAFNCSVANPTITCTPPAETLNVSSNANLQFTVAASINGTFTGFPNWLQLSQGSGTATSQGASIQVNVTPVGLVAGTYSGSITVSAPGYGINAVTVQVTLTVQGSGSLSFGSSSLSLTAAAGGSSISRNVTISSTQLVAAGDSLSFLASAASVGGWLSAAPTVGYATQGGTTITITASPGNLQSAASPYQGTVTVTDTAGNVTALQVTLTISGIPALTISPNAVNFSYTLAASVPNAQPLSIQSAAPVSVTVSASSQENWLSVDSPGGQTPLSVNVSANPAGLNPGTYCGQIIVTQTGVTQAQVIDSCLTVSAAAPSSSITKIIPHLADGAGWTTRVILVNTNSQQSADFEIKFWDETGNALTLPLGTDGNWSDFIGTIPPGSSRTIQTAGTSVNTVEGWAEVIVPSAVGGTSIFTFNNTTEAGAALSASGAQQIYFPFDNTPGFTTGLALANPGTQDAVVTFTLFDDFGNELLTTQLTVPKRGHWANTVNYAISSTSDFSLANGKRGVIQISSPVALYSLGIRGRGNNPALFTSLDGLFSVPAGNKVVPHLANGGGWATSIILINTDTAPAPFAINFFHEDGSPFPLPLGPDGLAASLSGVIQPGQTRILQTDGSGANLLEGWAQLVTAKSIGGTCIFTESGASEAAVTISAAGGTTLYVPYDNTSPFLTGLALSNTTNQSGSLSITFTTEAGQTIQPPQSIPPLNPQGHLALTLFDNSYGVTNTRGVVKVQSNISMFGVGIRSRNVGGFYTFTSLPVIPVNQ
jgi:hypothetical protein